MSSLDDSLQAVVDDLLSTVDSVDPSTWKPCWQQIDVLPHNALTGNRYAGSNIIFLWSAQLRRGYTRPVWATYKQWAQLGGQVRKGERGSHGIKWVTVADKEHPGTDRTRLVPNVFTVFNVAQQDGALVETDEPDLLEPIPEFERWLAPIPVKLSRGNPAYWPGADTVTMPDRSEFVDDVHWMGTFAHELAHWTGAKDRLNRDFGNRFGDSTYAMEELVAEMSSAFTCARLGVHTPALREDHAKYLGHWVSKLREQPRILLTVAQAAERATSFLSAYSTVEATDVDDVAA